MLQPGRFPIPTAQLGSNHLEVFLGYSETPSTGTLASVPLLTLQSPSVVIRPHFIPVFMVLLGATTTKESGAVGIISHVICRAVIIHTIHRARCFQFKTPDCTTILAFRPQSVNNNDRPKFRPTESIPNTPCKQTQHERNQNVTHSALLPCQGCMNPDKSPLS